MRQHSRLHLQPLGLYWWESRFAKTQTPPQTALWLFLPGGKLHPCQQLQPWKEDSRRRPSVREMDALCLPETCLLAALQWDDSQCGTLCSSLLWVALKIHATDFKRSRTPLWKSLLCLHLLSRWTGSIIGLFRAPEWPFVKWISEYWSVSGLHGMLQTRWPTPT